MTDVDSQLAVVGLACRFPGADTSEQFWANLAGGVDSVTRLPAQEVEGTRYVPACGLLARAEEFDAAFFGYSPREALIIDPQQRALLECSWQALEDAGYDPSRFPGAIGVYVGGSETGHLDALRRLGTAAAHEWQLRIGTGADHLATRVAYKLGLRGPAVNVQTACSTSLVAVHVAAQALLAGDCDMALAGGACVQVPPTPGRYTEGGVISPDGYCRAFDADARGTVGADGVGVVVLKRLADAVADGDDIRAVVRGTAVNNDGADKIGYTAPSVTGQAEVIRAAHLVAEVEPSTIGYVEAHGTGTALGDPIEVAALAKAFGPAVVPGSCRLGSVKTNIGHTDAAAGIAGFIKVVLMLQHRRLPPSLHFHTPNPHIDFAAGGFAVNTELRDWPAGAGPRRAGVSSFGIGGTNAHVVLEEAPDAGDPVRPGPARDWQLVVLSAVDRPALRQAADRLADRLRDLPEPALPDLAWTTQVGRAAQRHRRFVVCRDPAGARSELAGPPGRLTGTAVAAAEPPRVVFMFPGQGGQRVGMGRDLYQRESVFRAAVDECANLAAAGLGLDLREVLYPRAGSEPGAARQLARIGVGQPAVFTVEYALARLWQHWGIAPAAVVGHSLGGYAAGCVAGVFELAGAIDLVVERGRLLERLPAGAMLAVSLAEDELRPLLGTELEIAVVNGPQRCVVSGPAGAVARLGDRLAGRGVEARPLRIAAAGHSSWVDPIVPELRDRVAAVSLAPPRLPMLSESSGHWLSDVDATDPDYWARHLRRPVRFADALGTLLAGPDQVLLEVGPGAGLAALARQHPAANAGQVVLASLPHHRDPTPEYAALLAAAGELWARGHELHWPRLHDGERRRRRPLPTYPFQRRRYFVADLDSRPRAVLDEPSAAEPAPAPPDPAGQPAEDFVAPRTEVEHRLAAIFADVLGLDRIGVYEDFVDLGGDSLIATQLVARVRAEFAARITVRAVFEAPTVARLAAVVDTGRDRTGEVALAGRGGERVG